MCRLLPITTTALFSLAFVPFFLASHCQAEEAPTAGAPDSVSALVEQLGDDEYVRREEAAQRLVELGMSALDELNKATNHPDPEIKYRTARIIAIITEHDYEKRLTAFVSGKASGEEAGLPGWKEFERVFSDTRETRELFVDLQKSEGHALAAIERGPEAISEVLSVRTQELQQLLSGFRQQLSYGNVAAMIFLASIDKVEPTAQVNSTLYGFCYQPNFRNELMQGTRKDLSRKLMGAWIRRSHGWSLYQALNLAMQYDIREGLAPAERALREGSNQPHILQHAILAIARFGDQSNIPLLEKVLTRPEAKNRIGSQRINNVTYEAHLYDVALAAMIHLEGENPKEFGFERYQPNPQNVFNPGTVGFQSEELRQAAYTKWTEFRAKQAETDEPPGPEHRADEPPAPEQPKE